MNTLAISAYRLWKRFTGWPRAAAAEAGFMVLNDLFFVFVWYVVIQSKAIPGWGMPEALLFLGSTMVGFAIAMGLTGNGMNLEAMVDGTFDIYFLRPRSVWLQYVTDNDSASVFGDLAAGLFLLALCPYPLWVKVFTVASVVSVFLASTTTISGLFMGLRAINGQIFRDVHEIGFMQAIWPSHVIDSPILRAILLFVVPGLLYITLPIEVLRGESPAWLLLAGYVFWAIVATAAWKWGIKRYTGVSGIGWMAQ